MHSVKDKMPNIVDRKKLLQRVKEIDLLFPQTNQSEDISNNMAVETYNKQLRLFATRNGAIFIAFFDVGIINDFYTVVNTRQFKKALEKIKGNFVRLDYSYVGRTLTIIDIDNNKEIPVPILRDANYPDEYRPYLFEDLR